MRLGRTRSGDRRIDRLRQIRPPTENESAKDFGHYLPQYPVAFAARANARGMLKANHARESRYAAFGKASRPGPVTRDETREIGRIVADFEVGTTRLAQTRHAGWTTTPRQIRLIGIRAFVPTAAANFVLLTSPCPRRNEIQGRTENRDAMAVICVAWGLFR